MRRRFKTYLASKFEHPLLQLLVLDWRFTSLLMLIGGGVLFAMVLPLKVWRRTPAGFSPEVTVSALDLIQARALARSARAAEKKGNLEGALLSWSLALANDPCDEEILDAYIQALLRSRKRDDLHRALQLAGWFQSFSNAPVARRLLIIAAERNQAWDLILEASPAFTSVELPGEVQDSILRAYFRTGRYREAREFFDEISVEEPSASNRELYREALSCILDPKMQVEDCAILRGRLDAAFPDIESHEIYLITCAEKGNLELFEKTLASIRSITDQTIPFEAVYVRLLLKAGRYADARAAASRFRAPKSGRETFMIAEALLAVGDRNEAVNFLGGFSPEFDDTHAHLALYARLMLKEGRVEELQAFQRELLKRPPSAPVQLLSAAIAYRFSNTPARWSALRSALENLPPSWMFADVWFFSAEALLQAGEADRACELFARMEPNYLHNLEFHENYFAAAEAKRDAKLMRRLAERAYRLAPANFRAVSNYGAMLVMCDEEPEQALALSSACVQQNPSSLAARINHAAALINLERFSSADLILKDIDESLLPAAALNQFRYIKLKRALKLRDYSEGRRLFSLIDKSALYSIQLDWLSKHEGNL